jgi:hypothetical protein
MVGGATRVIEPSSGRRRFIRLTLKHCQPRFGVRDQLAKNVLYHPAHCEPKSGSRSHNAVTEPNGLVLQCHWSVRRKGQPLAK